MAPVTPATGPLLVGVPRQPTFPVTPPPQTTNLDPINDLLKLRTDAYHQAEIGTLLSNIAAMQHATRMETARNIK